MENTIQLNKPLAKKRRPLSDTNLLLVITFVVFIFMYLCAIIFLGAGFRKPQTLFKFNVPSAALPAYKAIVVIVLVVLSAPTVREKMKALSKKFKQKAAPAAVQGGN